MIPLFDQARDAATAADAAVRRGDNLGPLSVMAALEERFRSRPDYPVGAVVS